MQAMRFRLLLVLLLLSFTSLAAAAPATMRLDYYHTGNTTQEMFSVDRVVIEPLPWPGDPAKAIDDTFESFDALKAAVIDGGVKRFGSGWTWLVWDGTALAVYSTPNQDSPILQSDVPLLGIDVWEHAYYLKYQNKRPAYLEAWWNVVNWAEVGRRFEEARES